MKKTLTQKLRELATIKYFSQTTLASYMATNPKGAMLQTRRDIKELLKTDYIYQVDKVCFSHSNERARAFWYALTRKGYAESDMEDKYKRIDNLTAENEGNQHRTQKIDIALSLVRNNPDYDFKFYYSKSIAGKKPDILVKAKHRVTTKCYQFWVEIERRDNAGDVFNNKIKMINSLFDDFKINNRYKELGLFSNIKCLVVYADKGVNPYWRACEYRQADLAIQEKRYKKLLEYSKALDKNRFLFLPIWKFYLNEFDTPDGRQIKILS